MLEAEETDDRSYSEPDDDSIITVGAAVICVLENKDTRLVHRVTYIEDGPAGVFDCACLEYRAEMFFYKRVNAAVNCLTCIAETS